MQCLNDCETRTCNNKVNPSLLVPWKAIHFSSSSSEAKFLIFKKFHVSKKKLFKNKFLWQMIVLHLPTSGKNWKGVRVESITARCFNLPPLSGRTMFIFIFLDSCDYFFPSAPLKAPIASENWKRSVSSTANSVFKYFPILFQMLTRGTA